MIGLGTDAVDVDRFRAVLIRRPGLAERLFTPEERAHAAKRSDPTERLAVRFAAKEAVMKALGAGMFDVGFREIEVVTDTSGAPALRLRGRAAARAERRGVRVWHVSLTHTHRIAHAVVIAE